MNDYLEELEQGLKKREEQGLLRRLKDARGVDFTSNDYLGLSSDPSIRESLQTYLEDGDLGAPASRLLRGNHSEHTDVEREFANFKGDEAALLFSSGFQANLGMLTGLIGRHDRVLSDELNHASLIDGLRLSRAKRIVFPHLDLEALEARLARPHEQGRTFVLVESLFSMDGDVAPLDRIAQITSRYGGLLIVDEAHATGVYGETGAGLIDSFGVRDEVLATASTCGKAFGLAGAFITGSQLVIDHLVNHARSFIYSTAPMPLLSRAIRRAIEIVRSAPERRARVAELSKRLRLRLRDLGVQTALVNSPIVSVLLGDQHRALSVSRLLWERGYDVRALRPPTVPEGTSRLRISVHSNHTPEEIDGLADAVSESSKACPGALS